MSDSTGTVKWFSSARGWGFIFSGTDELFVHYSQIEMDGYRELREGQSVRFTVNEGPRGLYATAVVPLEASDV